MGTRLEQLQAAAKAKTAAGQPIFSAPVNAPQVQTPQVSTPAVSTPSTVKTTQPVPNMSTATAPATNNSAAIQTEIQRKAALGIPLTNTSNAANNAAYSAAVKAPVQTPAVSTPVQTPAYTPSANTNYVAQGGQTLNDLLYLKKSYEGGKTGAAAYATPLYSKLDPQTAAAVKGMNAAQLEAYISGQSGQPTAATQAPTEAPAVAAKDYRALAQAQYDQELSALLAGAQSQETELDRRFEYADQVTDDNRTLRDASYYRNNAPKAWDGSIDYRTAMQERQDGIEDHYTGEALKDNVAAAYSQANAFRGQAGNYLTTKAGELESADKQYNLQVAGLTGVLNGQQTMQGAANAASTAGQLLNNQSQVIANQIAQIDLSTYPQQAALQLQQLQQQVQSGKISNDTAAYQFSQLTDPASTTNQAAALELQMKQIDASNYSEQQKLQLEQLRKTVAEIGQQPYQSETDKQLDQLKVEQAKLELQKLREGEPAKADKDTTFEDVQSNIEKIAQRDKKTNAITNSTTVEDYILNSNLSPYEMYRAYGVYGLKWEGAAPSKGE